MNKQDLRYFQSMPLDIKVAMTKTRIREFVTAMGITDTYIAFSGGKDSTVLVDIAKQIYPDINIVYSDTGLEFPELREHALSIATKVVKPNKPFNRVVRENGYPIFTKNIAHSIGIAQKTKGNVYYNMFVNPKENSIYNMSKYLSIVDSTLIDFKISDMCCNIMKKEPVKKLHGYAITGEMATESKQRESQWLKHGCNHFDTKTAKSTPMAFWTEKDVFEYIYQNNIKIPSVYGKISCNGCTGYQRTGCVFCAYGMHLEKGKTRYQLLKETHPQLYNYSIDKLGFGHVFDTVNKVMGYDIFRY